jgi:hypothetical protein
MNNDLDRAKEIYFYYACNHFLLDRDVDHKEYTKYNIDRTLEAVWRREYILLWKSRLSIDDFTALNRLRDAWADEALPELIEIAPKGDSFAKLWYANAIWQLTRNSHISTVLRYKGKKIAIRLWQSLTFQNIQLTEKHREEIEGTLTKMIQIDQSYQLARSNAGHLPKATLVWANTPEEYILKYAKKQLAGVRKAESLFARIW